MDPVAEMTGRTPPRSGHGSYSAHRFVQPYCEERTSSGSVGGLWRSSIDFNNCSGGSSRDLSSTGPQEQAGLRPRFADRNAAANSGRLSLGSKSPLPTGTIKESNSGGTASQMLARLGIKALIVEGIPEDGKWRAVYINKDGARIEEETATVGMGNYETVQVLDERLDKKAGLIVLGPVAR